MSMNLTRTPICGLEEFDAKLNDARTKAKAEVDSFRGEAQAVGAEKLAGIRKEGEGKKTEGIAQIEAQIAAAGEELKGQVAGFATEMATKIMGRAV